MTRFARALPALREQVDADLTATDELTRERVLACAVRLLDRGFFRIGSEQYTVQNESFGLATMRKQHVTLDPEHSGMVFDYMAKSGKRRIQGVIDPAAFEVVSALKRRRGGGDELLAFKNGRAWCDVRSPDINEYLKDATGDDFSAKDFRTWAATMLAAIALAVSGEVAGTKTGRKRAVVRAVKEVSHYLGNTPAVCRASYIDPRVIDAYNGGLIIRGVLDGDRRHRRSPASCRSTSRSSRRPCSTCSTSGRRRRLWSGSRPDVRLRAPRSSSSRRLRNSSFSAGPPVTPWTTMETITQAIAVHTTSFSSPPERAPAADDGRRVVERPHPAHPEPRDERPAARRLDLRADEREEHAQRPDDHEQHDREQPALPARLGQPGAGEQRAEQQDRGELHELLDLLGARVDAPVELVVVLVAAEGQAAHEDGEEAVAARDLGDAVEHERGRDGVVAVERRARAARGRAASARSRPPTSPRRRRSPRRPRRHRGGRPRTTRRASPCRPPRRRRSRSGRAARRGRRCRPPRR